MKRKDLSEYKRKYQAFRHHAWAGLGFLSVVLAIRLIFLEQTQILTPLILILAIYILISLVFTYIYREGVSAADRIINVEPSVELEKEKMQAEVEKELLKIEKKKAKTEAKTKKKADNK